MKKDNIIQDKSFDFALKIIGLYQKLIEQKKILLQRCQFHQKKQGKLAIG